MGVSFFKIALLSYFALFRIADGAGQAQLGQDTPPPKEPPPPPPEENPPPPEE